ncbi:MAG: nucleoside hydrolase [Chloroflexota bacterium]
MRTNVIFDTDAGGDIDDLYALVLILKHPNLNLLGVTTVSADTQARARVIAKMLRLAERPDVPVYAGIRIPKAFVQRGMDETTYKQYLTHLELVTTDDPEHGQAYGDAVAFILEALRQTETPITLIGTGPWTNIAEVLRLADEQQKSMIDAVALMGGEVHLLHNESNVLHDPEAADLILHSGVPIFLATWSVCRHLTFTMAEVAALTHDSPSPFLQALREATDLWWNAGVDYKPGPMCYDVIPVFWAAGEREPISCIKLDELTVELAGTHTRGMMVVHPWERMNAEKTDTTSADYLTITDSLNTEVLKERYIDLVFNTNYVLEEHQC